MSHACPPRATRRPRARASRGGAYGRVCYGGLGITRSLYCSASDAAMPLGEFVLARTSRLPCVGCRAVSDKRH
eukprot:scaffold27246_cov114-Isochrysis_galbana.AAC.2